MGVDIGSATTKCVIMRSGEEITASAVYPGGTGTSGAERAVQAALADAALSIGDMDNIIATGYGRNTFKPASKNYSELSCHARGAFFLCPGVRTVIDIGGQDCKAIKLTEGGMLDSFSMNDKCAAGTGRFLEVMAKVLEMELQDLGSYSMGAQSVIDITSTCTVFAESEVISQLSKGADKRGIAAGIHRSVAVKATGIAKRTGIEEPVFFSGGVSQNIGVVRALSQELGMKIQTDPWAQLTGAIGAALLARERGK